MSKYCFKTFTILKVIHVPLKMNIVKIKNKNVFSSGSFGDVTENFQLYFINLHKNKLYLHVSTYSRQNKTVQPIILTLFILSCQWQQNVTCGLLIYIGQRELLPCHCNLYISILPTICLYCSEWGWGSVTMLDSLKQGIPQRLKHSRDMKSRYCEG